MPTQITGNQGISTQAADAPDKATVREQAESIAQAAVDQISPQIASAWVNFDGTGTVTIRDSYNVSSITDNGTGDYTVNFATALTDANYAVCYTTDNVQAFLKAASPPTASGVTVLSRDSGNTLIDTERNNIVILGGN